MLNCRLQARQIMLGEDPEAVQIEMSARLNSNDPGIHVATDIIQIAKLQATAKELSQSSEMNSATAHSTNTIEQAQQLVIEMASLGDAITLWTETVDGLWKPKVIHSPVFVDRLRRLHSLEHPLHHYPFLEILTYSEIWFAYLWNLHSACQIVLHEWLVQLLRFSVKIANRELSEDEVERIEQEQNKINTLAKSIIQSSPSLLGLTDELGSDLTIPLHGVMAGRFLAFFAIDVVQKSKFASAQLKYVATKMAQWISSSHALE